MTYKKKIQKLVTEEIEIRPSDVYTKSNYGLIIPETQMMHDIATYLIQNNLEIIEFRPVSKKGELYLSVFTLKAEQGKFGSSKSPRFILRKKEPKTITDWWE